MDYDPELEDVESFAPKKTSPKKSRSPSPKKKSPYSAGGGGNWMINPITNKVIGRKNDKGEFGKAFLEAKAALYAKNQENLEEQVTYPTKEAAMREQKRRSAMRAGEKTKTYYLIVDAAVAPRTRRIVRSKAGPHKYEGPFKSEDEARARGVALKLVKPKSTPTAKNSDEMAQIMGKNGEVLSEIKVMIKTKKDGVSIMKRNPKLVMAEELGAEVRFVQRGTLRSESSARRSAKAAEQGKGPKIVSSEQMKETVAAYRRAAKAAGKSQAKIDSFIENTLASDRSDGQKEGFIRGNIVKMNNKASGAKSSLCAKLVDREKYASNGGFPVPKGQAFTILNAEGVLGNGAVREHASQLAGVMGVAKFDKKSDAQVRAVLKRAFKEHYLVQAFGTSEKSTCDSQKNATAWSQL